jgi:AraC-like DNA-binding protein
VVANEHDLKTMQLEPALAPLDSAALLHHARDVIASGFDRPISLEDAAKEACLSPFHFHRLFSRKFGQTPHEFLTGRRIDAAKKLLTHSSLSVSEICFEVGYSSLGSFSAMFHRLVGCSPTDYRLGAAHFYALHRIWSHRFVPTCFTWSASDQ